MATTTKDACTTCGRPPQGDNWYKATRRDGNGWDCYACAETATAEGQGLPTTGLPDGAYVANTGGWCMAVRFDGPQDDDDQYQYRLLTARENIDGQPGWAVGTYLSEDCEGGDDLAVFTPDETKAAMAALAASFDGTTCDCAGCVYADGGSDPEWNVCGHCGSVRPVSQLATSVDSTAGHQSAVCKNGCDA